MEDSALRKLIRGLAASVLVVAASVPLKAQEKGELATRIEAVMSRPVFKNSNFGVEFLDLETGKVV